MKRDPKQIPLPGKYALVLGPLIGAAAGAGGFLKGMRPSDAWAMVALFAVIGLVAGALVFAYDSFRRKKK